jgi:hypothetical protein
MLDRNPTMTTKKWVMEGLSRAFGVCVTLRDDDMNLTEEQIKERIAKDSSIDYHQKELENALAEQCKIAVRTAEEWQKLWKKEDDRRTKANLKYLDEANSMAKRHLMVHQELAAVLASPEIDEVTRNIAKFGIDQLDLVSDECKPYHIESVTLKDFEKNAISENTRDIEYHTKELAAAKKRTQERLEMYDRLRKDLDSVLLDISSKPQTEVTKQ